MMGVFKVFQLQEMIGKVTKEQLCQGYLDTLN